MLMIYCDHHFTAYTCQIIILYMWNEYNIICKLYLQNLPPSQKPKTLVWVPGQLTADQSLAQALKF